MSSIIPSFKEDINTIHDYYCRQRKNGLVAGIEQEKIRMLNKQQTSMLLSYL